MSEVTPITPPAPVIKCPACFTGIMIIKYGPYGEFHACSNYPKCKKRMNQYEFNAMPKQ